MSFARNVGRYFHAIRESHTGDFTDSGVWFAGSLRRYLRAHATLKGRREVRRTIFKRVKATTKSEDFCLPRFVFATLLGELLNGSHLEKEDPAGSEPLYINACVNANLEIKEKDGVCLVRRPLSRPSCSLEWASTNSLLELVQFEPKSKPQGMGRGSTQSPAASLDPAFRHRCGDGDWGVPQRAPNTQIQKTPAETILFLFYKCNTVGFLQ